MSKMTIAKIVGGLLLLIAVIIGVMNYGDINESKALGFKDIKEMKTIHSLGWHTKKKYIEDTDGFKSDSERAFMNEHGFETRKEFDEFRSKAMAQKGAFLANRIAKKMTAQHATDCAVTTNIVSKANRSYPTSLSQEDLGWVGASAGPWNGVAEVANKNTNVKEEDLIKDLRKKTQSAIEDFQKSEESQKKMEAAGLACYFEIIPEIKKGNEVFAYIDAEDKKTGKKMIDQTSPESENIEKPKSSADIQNEKLRKVENQNEKLTKMLGVDTWAKCKNAQVGITMFLKRGDFNGADNYNQWVQMNNSLGLIINSWQEYLMKNGYSDTDLGNKMRARDGEFKSADDVARIFKNCLNEIGKVGNN